MEKSEWDTLEILAAAGLGIQAGVLDGRIAYINPGESFCYRDSFLTWEGLCCASH